MFQTSRLSFFHVSKKARNLDVSSNQSIVDAKAFLEARANYKLPVPQQYFRVYCPFLKRVTTPLPFGSELGRFRGVPAYSCHYESADPGKFKCDWDYMSYYCFERGAITSTGGKELVNLRCDDAVLTCPLRKDHGCPGNNNDDHNSKNEENGNDCGNKRCILSGDSLKHVTFDEDMLMTNNSNNGENSNNNNSSNIVVTPKEKKQPAPSRKQIGIYLGHMFQCVMAARFWLVKTYGLTFQDVSMAYDIFELEHFYRIVKVGETAKQHKLKKIKVLAMKNDGKLPTENKDLMETELYKRPLPGNILIWEEGGFFKCTGHVAVVTQVVEKNNDEECITVSQVVDGVEVAKKCNFGVRVWEQNFNDEDWQGRNYSRELPAYVDETTGVFVIVEPIWKSKVKGWMATHCMIDHEMKLLEGGQKQN